MATPETQPDEVGAQPIAIQTPKARPAFSALKREVTDKELSQSGTQKLLLDNLERAEEENTALKSFRDKYYETDKKLAVLEEKFKTNTAAEILSLGTITIGAAILVYVPELWDEQPAGWFALVIGFVLVGVGIFAKWTRS
jgi:hypothetical protein